MCKVTLYFGGLFYRVLGTLDVFICAKLLLTLCTLEAYCTKGTQVVSVAGFKSRNIKVNLAMPPGHVP